MVFNPRVVPPRAAPTAARVRKNPAMKIGPASVHRHRPYFLDGEIGSPAFTVSLFLPRTISLLKYSGRAREGSPSRMVHSNAERKSSRPHVNLPLTGGVPKSVSPGSLGISGSSLRRTRLYSSVLIISVTIAYAVFPRLAAAGPRVPALRFADGLPGFRRKGEGERGWRGVTGSKGREKANSVRRRSTP